MHAAVLDVMGSGQLSASGLVFAGPGWVTNLGIITDGSDNVTATLYDSATGANGTIIEGPGSGGAAGTIRDASRTAFTWFFPARAP